MPDKHRLGERPPAEITKARIRLVIESVFATLKRQMRMEDHLAKTLPRPRPTHRATTAGADPRHVHQHASSAAHREPWPPTTDDEPTSSL